MSEKHIDFAALSDLFDGLISTEEEKEKILHHLDKCDDCRKEYDSLRETVRLLKNIDRAETRYLNMTPIVLRRIKARRTIGMAKRYLPAAAAAVLVFAGGLNLLSPDKSMAPAVSSKEAEMLKDEISAAGSALPQQMMVTKREAGDLMKIIHRNNGTVVSSNDMFVEGEVAYESFSRLRRELGFRKVSFSYMARAAEREDFRREAPSAEKRFRSVNSNISDVSMSDRQPSDEEISVSSEPLIIAQNKKPRVKFRVYK